MVSFRLQQWSGNYTLMVQSIKYTGLGLLLNDCSEFKFKCPQRDPLKDGQVKVSDYSSEVAVNGLESDTEYTFVIEETIKQGIHGEQSMAFISF